MEESYPYIYIKLRPAWGYAVRQYPQSKMRISFNRPPPTTLIGALSYSFNRIRNDRKEIIYDKKEIVSNTEHIRNLLYSVNIRIMGRTLSYGSIYRINQIYRGKALSAVTALPSIFSFSSDDSILEILFLFKNL